MAVDSFQSVNWGEEEITPAKLNLMGSNEDWLYEHLPYVKYSGYGNIRRDLQTRIGSGVISIPKTTRKHQDLRVEFDNLFTTNCKPIIVTGITSHYVSRMTVCVWGFRGRGYVPLQDGFMATVACVEMDKENNYFQ
jgi:hypothetical protein